MQQRGLKVPQKFMALSSRATLEARYLLDLYRLQSGEAEEAGAHDTAFE